MSINSCQIERLLLLSADRKRLRRLSLHVSLASGVKINVVTTSVHDS
jgi:hypothetical protein